MMCPYVCNVVQVTQETFEYDVEGKTVSHQTVLRDTKAFVMCYKENCGAWRDGECHYKEFV